MKCIKIPIQPNSLLTERAEEEKRRANAFHEHDNVRARSSEGDCSDSDYENMEEAGSSRNQNVRTVSISSNLKDTEKFMKRMDDDIQKICQTVSIQKPDSSDLTRRLTTQCIHPRIARKKDSELGTIWGGLGWKSVVIALVFVAIILPVSYYVLDILSHTDKKNATSIETKYKNP